MRQETAHAARRGAALVLVFLAAAGIAAPAAAQWHPSARIYSLGGDDVSGVIPDYLTDLSLNPAYAAFADRLTVNYGQRASTFFLPAYPIATSSEDYYRPFDRPSSARTNEVSLWGVQAGSWRISAAAEWHFGGDEETSSKFRFYERNPQAISGTDLRRSRTELLRGSLSAGRAAGAGNAVGVRLEGFYGRDCDTEQSVQIWDYFSENDLLTIKSEEYRSILRDAVGRDTRFRIQGGLIANEGDASATEMTAGAAFSRTSTDITYYDLYTGEDYLAGEVVDYIYELDEWRDGRGGDRWIFDAAFRRALPADMRLYTGAEYSTIRYDTDWMNSARFSRWNLSSSNGSSDRSSFADEGRSQSVRWFGKLGKRFPVRGDLALYAGVHAAYRRTWADEDPRIHYAFAATNPFDTVSYDQSVSVESLRQEGRLALPISIEYAPRAYCTFFCGLIPYVEAEDVWHDLPAPRFIEYYVSGSGTGTVLLAPGAAQAPLLDGFPGNVSESDRSLAASYTAVLGLSLHYGDRFSFDLFTGNGPVPGSITNTYLDLRYAF